MSTKPSNATKPSYASVQKRRQIGQKKCQERDSKEERAPIENVAP